MKKLVEKLNFTMDIDHLRYYYHLLEKDFQKYNWIYKDHITEIRQDLYEYLMMSQNKEASIGGYGWAITFPKALEEGKPIAPWTRVHTDFVDTPAFINAQFHTPMVQGIIESLINKIPYVKNISLSVIQPGICVEPHIDEDYLLKIHVPIYTAPSVRWMNREGYTEMSEVGTPYLCDTRQMHAVYNDSKVDRVHLLFCIEDKYLDHIRKLTGTIT